jgi:O-antigen/teichoic acid export membrane protein
LAVSNKDVVVRGIAWSTLYQIVQAALTFGVMLVLVRVIPPVEYGKAATVLGILTLLSAFNCHRFVSYALQLPAGEEPDWSTYFSFAFYIQMALSAACHVVAGIFWLLPSYRSIAPLLHIAALGILLDGPTQVRVAMLQRNLDFRRFRIVLTACTLANIVSSLIIALAGGGAYAIVIGGNVASAIPFLVDLLIVTGWRPRPEWWRWPNTAVHRPLLRFGLQQVSAGVLHGAHSFLASFVLPTTLGFAAMGLLDRAWGLFSTTVGRVSTSVLETVYPLLPRYAADHDRYPQQATLFTQVMMMVAIPGAVFLGLEGAALSHLVYGDKWVAADPLFLPGACAGLGLTMLYTGSSILLAANRLRNCFSLDVLGAALSVPILFVALAGGGMIGYAWALAAGQLLLGSIALAQASPLLLSGWVRVSLLPIAAASALGAAAILLAEQHVAGMPLFVRLGLSTSLYVSVVALSIRVLFADTLGALLTRLPGELLMRRLLWLPSTPI